jgi:hypothetical protein
MECPGGIGVARLLLSACLAVRDRKASERRRHLQLVRRPLRVINQRFLFQLLKGDARYMLADDAYLQSDLDWAGFKLEQQTTHGFRFRPDSWDRS